MFDNMKLFSFLKVCVRSEFAIVIVFNYTFI